MKAHDYQHELKQRLEVYFDVQEQEEFGGQPMDLVGHYLRRNERYLMLKKNVMYAYENHETFLFLAREQVSVAELEAVLEDVKQEILRRVNPSEEHMSTDYTLVLHVKQIDPELRSWIQNYKYRKMFCLGFKGRVHLGLVAIDEEGAIFYSPDRREKRYRFLDMKENA